MRRGQRIAVIVCTLLLTSIVSTAQDRVAWQRIYNRQQTQIYTRTAMTTNTILRAHRHRYGGGARVGTGGSTRWPVRGGASGSNGTGTARNTTHGSTTFRSASSTIVPQQMAAEIASDPSERRELQAFFTQCLQNYEANMRRQGQPVKDVARALSYLIGVSYNVYHGGNVLTPEQGAALRAEVREALASDADFLRMPDREKQQMYESLAVMAEYVAFGADVAAQKGNRELAEMAREMAKDNLEKVLGTSVDKIRVSDTGLIF
ncbi:MAG TPA: DUF6683 family protein [Pyrinomonadaceae bacterium]|jgi:hypothetical protein